MASSIDVNQHRLFLTMLDGTTMVDEDSKSPSKLKSQQKQFKSYAEQSRVYDARHVKVQKSALRILKTTGEALAASDPANVASKQSHFSLARDKVILMLTQTAHRDKIEGDLERVMGTIAAKNGVKNVSTPARRERSVKRTAPRRRVIVPTGGLLTETRVRRGIQAAPTFGGSTAPLVETRVTIGGDGAAMAGETAGRQVGRLFATSTLSTSASRGAEVPVAFFQRGEIEANRALIDSICEQNPDRAALIRAEIGASDTYSVTIYKNSMSIHHSTLGSDYTKRIDFNTLGGNRRTETRVSADASKLVAARAALRSVDGRTPLGELSA